MNIRTYLFGLFLFLIASQGVADSITFNGQTYSDVYVNKGSKLYYVSIPADGTIMNVPFDQASGVTITEDREARNALYKEWQAKNNAKRGISEAVVAAPPEPKPSTATAEASPGSKGLKPFKKDTSSEIDNETISYSGSGSSASGGSNPYVYQQRLQEMALNAQIAARRQQYEAAKMQRLRNVRVITSQDAASAGGRGGMGGMNGGYGGGMGGMGGGMGGRRR